MPRLTFTTAFGRCAVAWNDVGLTGFELPVAELRTDDQAEPPPQIAALIARVRQHFDRDFQDFRDVPFDDASVPEFAREVYRATLAVQAGHTSTYGEIAAAIGQPSGASRAVGAALGANPWPLLVPCHRIVAAGGKMTGFSAPGGVQTKLRLLALEGAEMFPI